MHFKRISNSSLSITHPPPHHPSRPHSCLLLPALLPAVTPTIWEMNSPDSGHAAQNYNLPFGKSASGSIVVPEIELAHQQTLNSSSRPCSRLPLAPSPPCLSQVLLRCGSSRSRKLPFKMLTKERTFETGRAFHITQLLTEMCAFKAVIKERLDLA